MSTNNGRPLLLCNEGGRAANWLTLRLVGRQSNRNGFGARVRVTSGGLTQTDQARSGSSYLSQSDPRLHFGLGSSRAPVEVEVRGPSGTIDHLRNVRPDQLLTITEGQTASSGRRGSAGKLRLSVSSGAP